MPSSETVDPLALSAGRVLLVGSLLAAACSAPPAATQTVATQTTVECVGGDAAVAPQDADTVASVRQTVERGPLYASLTARSAVASCRIDRQSSEVALQYTFGDGGRLDVKHDPRIEYNNQEVRFASPPAEDPVELLKRVEQAAFANGCGIDWGQASTQPASNDPNTTENVYRGDVCNCQGRVRQDAGGRVVGLIFRSAC